MSTAMLDRQSLQERQGGVWEYVSPSRLNCWIACPRKFAIRYVEGIRSPTTPSLLVGKVVHGALERWYRHRQLGVSVETADIIVRFGDLWGQTVDEENMTFDSATEEQALQKQAVDLVKAYLAYVPADEPRPLAVETAVEAPLVDPTTGEDLGILLVGIMDLVLDDTAGPVIADFKTSARSTEPLEITHEIQLTSYSYLFRHSAQQEEVGLEIRSLVKTKTPKVEFHAYPARTEAHMRRFFAVVHEYLDSLDAGRFNYRPGFGCAMCDYKDGPCRQWAG
jgi:putative RecB family exonuclease